MWAEKMRSEWQHTSTLCSYMLEVNKAKKNTKVPTPNDLNPMESSGPPKKGFKLNSVEGFGALQGVSKCQPKH